YCSRVPPSKSITTATAMLSSLGSLPPAMSASAAILTGAVFPRIGQMAHFRFLGRLADAPTWRGPRCCVAMIRIAHTPERATHRRPALVLTLAVVVMAALAAGAMAATGLGRATK